MDKSANTSEPTCDVKPQILDITKTSESLAGEAFWNKLESEKGIDIPIYVKNILTLNNLDTPLLFQCINDDTFRELEEFVRESMKDFLNKGDNLVQYYGRYQKIPNKFRFLVGDRYLIKNLVSFVKSKSSDFWKINYTEPPPFNHSLSQSYVNGDIVSGSEDEELPKTPVEKGPPNREKEKQELVRLVRDAVKRDLRSNPEKLALMKNAIVKVQIRRIVDKDTKEEKFVSVGTIKCMICAVTITIRKSHKNVGKRSRWIISNFRRHVRKHLIISKTVNSLFEDDLESKDTEDHKENGSTMYNADDVEDEDQNEVSYTVEW